MPLPYCLGRVRTRELAALSHWLPHPSLPPPGGGRSSLCRTSTWSPGCISIHQTTRHRHLSCSFFGETSRWLRSGLPAQDRGMVAPMYLDSPDDTPQTSLMLIFRGNIPMAPERLARAGPRDGRPDVSRFSRRHATDISRAHFSGKHPDGSGAACPRRTAGWSPRCISILQTTPLRQTSFFRRKS